MKRKCISMKRSIASLIAAGKSSVIFAVPVSKKIVFQEAVSRYSMIAEQIVNAKTYLCADIRQD